MAGMKFCFVCLLQYGVVVAWGLSQVEEQEIVQQVARKCEEQPLPPGEVEIDQVSQSTGGIKRS